MIYSILGFVCIVGAIISPFLFWSMVKKTINEKLPLIECSILSILAVSFVFWLVSVFGSLPTV